jgi:hypothetical protein
MNYIKSAQQFLWPQQLISNDSGLWIIDCYRWALDTFDNREFYSRTLLIQPNNQYFPGDVASVEEKAETIFKHSLKYAGLVHWPFELSHTKLPSQKEVRHFGLDKLERNSQSSINRLNAESPIAISYNPQLTLKPEDLASHFSHLFAQHLVLQGNKQPPGGVDYALEASEVLAVFMGFGVLFANSAYTFRGGCGSCYNAAANRQACLSESEILFALAVFCHLKKIASNTVNKSIKKHLKPSFAIAKRQLENMFKTDELLSLGVSHD